MQGLFGLAHRLYQQQSKDKNKLYSIHAPEVECISKGKAHKRYEFGCKLGVWVVAVQAFHGNPYDGHALEQSLSQVTRTSPVAAEQVFVDGVYQKHNYQGAAMVQVARRSKKFKPGLKRWLKRRAAIEPIIGHLNHDKRLERNCLKGQLGDGLNAVLSGAGDNFMKLIKALKALIFCCFALLPPKVLRHLCLTRSLSVVRRLFQYRLST